MRKSIFLIGAVGLISSTALNSQVTIGADAPPNLGALLELKESVVPDATNSTAKKGMLFPRVALESRNNLFPMFDAVAGNNYTKDGNPFPKSEEDISHTGLVV